MADRTNADAVKITLYALQTCSHCKEVKQLLKQRRIRYEIVYVDILVGEERSNTLRHLKRINPAISFPTLQVGARIIVGDKKMEIQEALDSCGR